MWKSTAATKQPFPDFLEKEIKLEEYMEAQPLQRLKDWLYKKSLETVKNKTRSLKRTS